MSKSILSYFKAKWGAKSTKEDSNVAATQGSAFRAITGISQEEVSIIVDEIEEASAIKSKRRRVTYNEADKLRIAKYAHLHYTKSSG